MEAHGNEYLAQLLDRAANLIQSQAEQDQHPDAAQWLTDYQQEKARFGQPEGSPAYAETRGAEGEGADQPSETGTKTKSAPRAQK